MTDGITGLTVDGGDSGDLSLMASAPTELIIDDDETQTYVLTLDPSTQTPKEGAKDITVSLVAKPAHVEGTKLLTLNLDKPAPDYTLSIADSTAPADVLLSSPAVTIGVGWLRGVASSIETATITVMTADNDKNREDDTLTLTAYSGRAGAADPEDSLAITLTDNNELPAVAMVVTDMAGKVDDPQPTSVTEGDTIYVVVMPVDKDGDAVAATEDLTVTLNPTGTADSADYEVVRTITIASRSRCERFGRTRGEYER